MGIRNLTKLLTRHCPDVIKPTTLEAFRGKTLALDANLLMQKFHHGSDRPALTMWYRFIMSLTERFDITPICIFDGPTRLPQKLKENQRRRAAKELMNKRAKLESSRSDRVDAAAVAMSELNKLPTELQTLVMERIRTPAQADTSAIQPALQDIAANLQALAIASPSSSESDLKPSAIQQRLNDMQDGIYSQFASNALTTSEKDSLHDNLVQLQMKSALLSQKYTKRSAPVVQEQYDKLQLLLHAMGIPCITTSEETPHEAEALGAVLAGAGLAAAVVTEDSDVLLYDATMLRNALGYKIESTLIDGIEVRDRLGMEREQFIDMCLLCGSDFAETLPGIGHVTAYKLIKEHGSIEAIIQADQSRTQPKYLHPNLDDYLQQISLAREVFNIPPCPPSDSSSLRRRDPSADLESVLVKFDLKNEWVQDGEWSTSASFFDDDPSLSSYDDFDGDRLNAKAG